MIILFWLFVHFAPFNVFAMLVSFRLKTAFCTWSPSFFDSLTRHCSPCDRISSHRTPTHSHTRRELKKGAKPKSTQHIMRRVLHFSVGFFALFFFVRVKWSFCANAIRAAPCILVVVAVVDATTRSDAVVARAPSHRASVCEPCCAFHTQLTTHSVRVCV